MIIKKHYSRKLIVLILILAMVPFYGCRHSEESLPSGSSDSEDESSIIFTESVEKSSETTAALASEDITTEPEKPTNTPTPTPSATPTPTSTVTPTSTPTPTPSPRPVLDKKLARSIVADAIAYSYNGKKYEAAYRYDVNNDGVKDLIIKSDELSVCVAYAVKDKDLIRVGDTGSFNAAVDVYSSSKLKKLIVHVARGGMSYFGESHYSFNKGVFNEDTHLEEEYYDHDYDNPIATYYVNGKETSKSKYDKKISSYGKLKELKKVKNFTKRTVDIPTELLPDMLDYLENDLFSYGWMKGYVLDINSDGINDCFFTIPYRILGDSDSNGLDLSNLYNNGANHDWMSVTVVMLSKKSGYEVRYLQASKVTKFLNNLMGK